MSGSAMLGRMWRNRMRTRPTPRDPGGRDEVALRDAGHQRLGQPGERGSAGEADREHRAVAPDAEDDGEEQGEQQPGEGHRDVDRRRDTAGRTGDRGGRAPSPGAGRRSGRRRSRAGRARPRAAWPPAPGRGCRARGCRCRPSGRRTARRACCWCRRRPPGRPRGSAPTRASTSTTPSQERDGGSGRAGVTAATLRAERRDVTAQSSRIIERGSSSASTTSTIVLTSSTPTP